MTQVEKPRPIVDTLSQEWFDAAREGRFLIQRRDHDGGLQWYPRGHALGTLDCGVSWVEASGFGTVHTFTVVHRTANAEFADDCPYVLAVVELAEGPRVTTRIVNTDPHQVHCEQRVRVVFVHDGETVLPYFEPAEEQT
ncbi:Zn-ribbon domain-containing OB-fold protein [Streptomyces sp. Inha503]|uniref:Zn-ribbon domain-containing OB-fold protein n=1 Tax=Streptomyces sp. Inha503 TaxID=3383314 RepID=UPI0039A33975